MRLTTILFQDGRLADQLRRRSVIVDPTRAPRVQLKPLAGVHVESAEIDVREREYVGPYVAAC